MKHYSQLLFILFFAFLSTTSLSQVKDIGRYFDKEGYVQDVHAADATLIINFISEDEISEEVVNLKDPKTGKLPAGIMSMDMFRPGLKLNIKGEFFETRKLSIASEIEVVGASTSHRSISDGRIDAIADGFAYIDGNRVKLAPAEKIEGVEGYQNKTFSAFEELKLGDVANVGGAYDNDFHFLADKVEVEPDEESRIDKGLKLRDGEGSAKLYAIWKDPQKRRKYLGKVYGGKTITDNAKIQDYVMSIGTRLIPSHVKERMSFSFIVVDDPSFNAQVTPTGIGIINTGVFDHVENEAQLAFIIAHEITHCIYKHEAQDIDRSKKTVSKQRVIGQVRSSASIIAKAVTKKSSADEKAMVSDEEAGDIFYEELPASLFKKLKSDHSVRSELQADRVGLYLMVNAGYDPREACKIWKSYYNDMQLVAMQKEVTVEETPVKKEKKDPKATKGKKESSAAATGARKGLASMDAKSMKTHPDDVKRFKVLNDYIAMYWSAPAFISKAQKGEAQYDKNVN